MGTLSIVQKEITEDFVKNLGLSQRESLIEAKFIFEYVLKKSYSQIISVQPITLSNEESVLIQEIVKLRLQKKPLAYIFNEWDFYGETFHINEHVLIPRQDTELLIDLVLKQYKKEVSMNICDLGTGSGIIGITLARHYQSSKVIIADISSDALLIAQKNIEKFDLKNIKTFRSDWYQNLPKTQFDLVISNPPYVDSTDPYLNKDELKFEPPSALYSDNKGYSDIEKIINHSPDYLKEGGQLIIEHGYNQADQVKAIFQSAKFISINQYQDINSKIRVTSGFI
ncbi:MAG: peptide chain release factor N(5)-glutamine methyltransferase [Proteobacteria bacterium]|jgi:release factor glutamine methyltransferase|nr:peptide chain release factor N(5)-glutamine methyltransferase [Pseudomonadota bacterium]|tara:strand:+ start:1759 stop:2607 length:849 start_codon:yes stop_codon:yes gene_type:complete